MYEANFGLKRRPFAATPDATCFLSAGPIQAALDEIVVCIEQGQGIAVLTAPAGIGKTLLCERICLELSDRFQIVFLRHSSFLTRRALLQTLLSELNHPYQHPSEQELRLELLPAIRKLRTEKEALVVICDEAHHLNESLLEELRILGDHADAGSPLVRLVLSGQLSLEEKLAQPGMEAFNQRIRAQVNLPTFDRAGTLDYIDYRLTWGGGRTEELFDPAALDVIARASDGIPRCINQLADHALLLSFVAEQRPVTEEIVLEALNDLRRLPLHWNEPIRSSRSTAHRTDQDSLGFDETDEELQGPASKPAAAAVVHSYEPSGDEMSSDSLDDGFAAVEFGADIAPVIEQPSLKRPATIEISMPDLEPQHPANEIRVDVTSGEWRETLDLFASTARAGKVSALDQSTNIVESPRSSHLNTSVSTPVAASVPTATMPLHAKPAQVADAFDEEIVVDRYAAIDAGLLPIAVADIPKPAEVRPVAPVVEQIFRNETLRSASDSAFLDPDAEFSELDADEVFAKSDDSTAVDEEELDPETLQLNDVLGTVRGLIDFVAEHAAEEPSADRLDPPHPIAPPKSPREAVDESLLKALRRDDLTPVMSVPTDDELDSADGEPAAAWESVETDAVEETMTQRPFRYLFSMLRRKQQQSR